MADKMESLKILGAVIGVIVSGVAALFALRRFYHWLRPIRIEPGIKRFPYKSEPDQIIATITNVSGEDQVLVKCCARSAYPIRRALLRHFKKPFTPPRLYNNIWYSAICFDLMGNSPLRLAPYEQIKLNYSLSNHPLCLFLTPLVQLEIELSNGRIFRSKRFLVPETWRLKAVRSITKGNKSSERADGQHFSHNLDQKQSKC